MVLARARLAGLCAGIIGFFGLLVALAVLAAVVLFLGIVVVI